VDVHPARQHPPLGRAGRAGHGFRDARRERNTKTLKVYFGATQVAALSSTANGASWRSTSLVVRTGAATPRGKGDVFVGLGTFNVVQTAPAEALSGTVLILMTGQNGVASANDVVFQGAVVECL
jgi:hypothetical protein